MELMTYEWRRAKSIRTTWITSFFVIASAVGFAYLGTLAFADAADTPVAAPTRLARPYPPRLTASP